MCIEEETWHGKVYLPCVPFGVLLKKHSLLVWQSQPKILPGVGCLNVRHMCCRTLFID